MTEVWGCLCTSVPLDVGMKLFWKLLWQHPGSWALQQGNQVRSSSLRMLLFGLPSHSCTIPSLERERESCWST